MQISHRRLHDRRGLLENVGTWFNGRDDQNLEKSNQLRSDENSQPLMRRGDDDDSQLSTVVQVVRTTVRQIYERDGTQSAQLAEDQLVTAGGEPTTTNLPTVPSAIHNKGDTSSIGSVLAQATGHASVPPETTLAQSAITSSSLSASATSKTTSSDGERSGGISAGVTAGIAFGILGALLIVGLIVFLVFNSRKKQNRKRANEEKRNARAERRDRERERRAGGGSAPGGNSDRPNRPARTPRVSLRPITQFFPHLTSDKQTDKGSAMALTSTATSVARNHPQERSGTSQDYNDPSNPFGRLAERAPSPNHGRSPLDQIIQMGRDSVVSQNPFSSPADAAPVPAMSRKTSLRKDLRYKPAARLPSFAEPPSPSIYSTDTGPISPVGSLAGSTAESSRVHRVQLDFKPTLEDEMELKAGELVQLLHEYDDGWALCVRPDKSQQGVVPRTCLSTRPVKPRPANGGGRQGPPVHPYGASHPQSPAGNPMSPRPGQSTEFRSQSPAPLQPKSLAVRSQSPSNTGRRIDPSGRSPMNPRPGQAM